MHYRKKPKKLCLKNRVEEHAEKAVVDFTIEKPAYGQFRTSNEMKKKAIFASPGEIHLVSP